MLSTENEIINRVALSPLITIDLKDFYTQGERVVYDLKQNLFQELILREKDFRNFLKTHDWTFYQDKFVALTCSTDAIIPLWAYMLLTVHLEGYAKKIVCGSLEQLETELFKENLQNNLDLESLKGQKVVLKGCSDLPIPTAAYVEISKILKPIVASLMFGEPCSTVPIFKQKA